MTDTPTDRCYCSTTIQSVRPAIVFVLMVLLSAASGVESSKDLKAVRVTRVKKAGYTSIVVENRNACEVTVALTITAEKDVSVARITAQTATYPGNSQTEAARVSAAGPGAAWHGRYEFRWTKGRMGAKHDGKILYVLPFEKGQSHQVIQSYNGHLTHRGPNRYAVDFAMSEGTTVCAAREGIVVDLKESSTTGGRDKKLTNQSNYVSIAHADGTIGEYHHLKHDGVLVEVGQRVTAGQPIALSGNTGYSTSPHLHFGVYSAANAESLQSHRITFTTGQGTIAEPREGKVYTAK
jgi:murein DD-endopeptidase MepM/ murein hydrolase activator NlpD